MLNSLILYWISIPIWSYCTNSPWYYTFTRSFYLFGCILSVNFNFTLWILLDHFTLWILFD